MPGMKTDRKDRFVVRLKFEGLARSVSQLKLAGGPLLKAGSGERFWYEANTSTPEPADTERDRGPDAARIEQFESSIKVEFGNKLLRRLQEHCGADADLGGVKIQVQQLSYASLDLRVLVEGLGKLADCFDDNFQGFRLAFEQFGAMALADCVPGTQASCRIVNARSLWNAFDDASGGVASPMDADPKGSDRERRARQLGWLWILSNTSLIVPTLLALGVLYVARADLAEERQEARSRSAEVQAREMALIKAYDDRQHDLDAVLVEALRSSASAAARSPCCCNTCPSPARPASGPASRPCGDCR